MTYEVVVTARAEKQLLENAIWWADNHSVEQALQWHDRFIRAIEGLASSPERQPLCRENPFFSVELRELRFGMSTRPTHRAVFAIREERVVVYTVRHLAQDDLTPEEI